MHKHLTIDEIKDAMAKAHTLQYCKEKDGKDYIVIVDSDDRIHRVYCSVEGTELEELYEEISVKDIIKRISKYLAQFVTVEKLLADRLAHTYLKDLLDLDERIKKEPEVKERIRCYSLEVAGKRGRKAEIEFW